MNARAQRTPVAFWWYLASVHVLCALFMLSLGTMQLESRWPLQVPLPWFVALVDVILAPALVYAWLSRARPQLAFFGALVIAGIGTVTAWLWIGETQTRALVDTLPTARTMSAAGLASALLLYEARVLWRVAAYWKHPNFDQAISLATRGNGEDTRARKLFRQLHASELRFWAYGLIPRAPATATFPGTVHFSYGAQSGNANTWIAWGVMNAAPTPLIHFLLHQVSPLAAGLTTLATLMGSWWCFVEARASKRRPVSVDSEWIHLRYGLIVDRKIARAQVVSIERLHWKDLDRRDITRHAGCGAPNLQLVLDTGEILQIGLDDPDRFIATLAGGG